MDWTGAVLGKNEMKTYISWSGGKDSTASVILAHEHDMVIDGVVFSEVMFDNSRNISGENPAHIKWIHEKAIPIIENMFGYKVYVLRDKSDYLNEFNHIITKSKHDSRNGKKRGFLFAGKCVANRCLKIRPIQKFYRGVGEFYQIVGIAADETRRLARLSDNKYSLLEKFGITEKETYDICRKYGLLSPIYKNCKRGGCWFCPNASMKELANLKKQYPELWNELKILSCEENVAHTKFMYTRTFAEVDKAIDVINRQASIFEMIGDGD